MKPQTQKIAIAALGLLFGVTLSRTGFSSWGELHGMLSLSSTRLWLTLCGSTLFTFIAVRAMGLAKRLPRPAMDRNAIVGGALFGAGWSLSGGCPGGAITQLGEGQLPALLTMTGIYAGMRLLAFIRGTQKSPCEIQLPPAGTPSAGQRA